MNIQEHAASFTLSLNYTCQIPYLRKKGVQAKGSLLRSVSRKHLHYRSHPQPLFQIHSVLNLSCLHALSKPSYASQFNLTKNGVVSVAT